MLASLPSRPDLSEAEVALLRQVAGGHLNEPVSRATGIVTAEVGPAIKALTARLGTPHRHRAAALGAAWGWVRTEDVPVSHPTGLPLPRRQQEVLAGLVAGEEPGKTAKRLGLAESTVRTYIQNIHRTLGVRSRQQAAALAVLSGIVSLSALGDGWPDTRLTENDSPTAEPPTAG
ncbi:LuxR C-terminal-related transcriptional regulator [Kitasatospora sp. NPDC048296]|uniref:helix-turn-helix transcriptional regulator n=1 Tax=Kitasatospora sp. NPDC048296 TaxID=3364048 RepID=UPI00372296CF